MNMIKPVRATDKGQNFFGYYDKHQFDETDRYILANRALFNNRPPTANDTIDIMLIDTKNNFKAERISSSAAWCWQQGCMLQWIDKDTIIHNDILNGEFVSKIIDVKTKSEKILPRAIYTVNGSKALSLNFARNAVLRPGYGYVGAKDKTENIQSPDDDGIFLMDIDTGKHELLFSIDSMKNTQHNENMNNTMHWFNHLLFNPSGERFIFLHRFLKKEKGWYTRLCTADKNGENIFVSDLVMASHFIWKNDSEILVWGEDREQGDNYYMVTDITGEKEKFGGSNFTRDGHITLSPNGRWAMTDEYPNEEFIRPLIFYDIEKDIRHDVAKLDVPKRFLSPDEIRCDLHPRWNRAGDRVCIDSVHEGDRQMYVFDVEDLCR